MPLCSTRNQKDLGGNGDEATQQFHVFVITLNSLNTIFYELRWIIKLLKL